MRCLGRVSGLQDGAAQLLVFTRYRGERGVVCTVHSVNVLFIAYNKYYLQMERNFAIIFVCQENFILL